MTNWKPDRSFHASPQMATGEAPQDVRSKSRMKPLLSLAYLAVLTIGVTAQSLDLVVSGKTTLEASVKEAMGHATFAVCAIAMKNQKVETSQLLSDVQVVPDGIGEIVAKQRARWGYIKVGH